MAETFTDVPIQTLRLFVQYVADNNLWDEVEQLLKTKGHTHIRMSFKPTNAVAQLLKQKVAAATKPGQAQHPIAECARLGGGPLDGDGGAGGDGGDPPEMQ